MIRSTTPLLRAAMALFLGICSGGVAAIAMLFLGLLVTALNRQAGLLTMTLGAAIGFIVVTLATAWRAWRSPDTARSPR